MKIADHATEFITSLPEVQVVEHWGKPSYRIKNKIFAVFQEDGRTLTLKTTAEDRAIYTSMDPLAFLIPDTFSHLLYMHVNMEKAEWGELQGLIYKAWSLVAPKKIVKEYGEFSLEKS